MLRHCAESLLALLRVYGFEERHGSRAISFLGPIEGSFFSATIPFDLDGGEEAAQQALAVAADTGRRQWCWTHSGSSASLSCWRLGFQQAPSVALMTAEPGRSRPEAAPRLPASATITRVTDAASCESFRRVHLAQFAAADPSANHTDTVNLFASNAVLLHPSLRALVLSHDDEPVAAGYSLTTTTSHGIYWVATTPSHRRCGYGGRITAQLAAAGPENSAILLQSTRMGFGLYRGLGFSCHGLIERWITPP